MEGRFYYENVVASILLANLIITTGLNTLPYSSVEAGFMLVVPAVVFTSIISYISATYIIETLASANAYQYSLLRYRSPLMPEGYKVKIKRSVRFEYHNRNEMEDLISLYFPGWGGKFLYGMIITYIFCMLCIQTMELAITYTQALGLYIFQDVQGLNSLFYWIGGGYSMFVISFFLICLLPSLKNVTSLQWIGTLLTAIKGFVIICFLVGTFMAITSSENDTGNFDVPAVEPDLPAVEPVVPAVEPIQTYSEDLDFEGGFLLNFRYLGYLISNLNIAFLIHYSLPGIVYPLKDQFHAKKLIIAPIISAGVFFIFQSLFAIIGFEDVKNTDCAVFPCRIQSIYSLNFMPIAFIGQVVSFYTIANILPILLKLSTIRNYFLQFFYPEKVRLGKIFDLATISFTLLVMIPAGLIVIFTPDIQDLILLTGGILGNLLLIIVPTLLVRASRIKQQEFYQAIMDEDVNRHISPFKSSLWIYLLWLYSLGNLTLTFWTLFT